MRAHRTEKRNVAAVAKGDAFSIPQADNGEREIQIQKGENTRVDGRDGECNHGRTSSMKNPLAADYKRFQKLSDY